MAKQPPLSVVVGPIKIDPVATTGPVNNLVAPVSFTFPLTFQDTLPFSPRDKKKVIFTTSASVIALTKVPGGPGLSRVLDGDVIVNRVFRLKTKPKVVLAQATTNSKGEVVVTIELIIESKKVKPGGYSNAEKKRMRQFEMKNPPANITGSAPGRVDVSPCPNDDDTRVLFTFTTTRR